MSDIALTPGATRAYHLDREPHPENGTALGFWLYLMSDCLIFAALFATYGVLGRSYAGGPGGAELFDLKLVAINTAFLLLSSITFGFAMLRKQLNDKTGTLVWLAVTLVFGLAFLSLELYEFHHLIHEGYGPQRSFAYMPYMHSESALIHGQAVALFSQPGMADTLRFELQHKAIIDRFGRYPHRNAILGRSSTAEELAFLSEPGSSF